MLKRLAKCVREYKKYVVWTLLFIVGEAVIETLIPFITANLINDIKAGLDMAEIVKTGIVLIVAIYIDVLKNRKTA